MAKKKAVGSLKNGRDSKSKRLGLKKNHGQHVLLGEIIIRQKGLKYKPGNNTGIGKDYTIYSLKSGILNFTKGLKTRINVI
ncbi:50S ribosomal protein L27 [Candidatus Vidania fulgoroideorum]